MEWLSDLMASVQDALFETVVQPLAFALGWGGILEQAFEATGWFLVGVLQLTIMLGVFMPLERWRPVEPVVDRAAVRTDVLYTLIHRLGFFKLFFFFTCQPLNQFCLTVFESSFLIYRNDHLFHLYGRNWLAVRFQFF